jgi:hypothetical protein
VFDDGFCLFFTFSSAKSMDNSANDIENVEKSGSKHDFLPDNVYFCAPKQ